MKPVFTELFNGDGRGPELVRVYYSPTGSSLLAVDFQNVDGEPSHLRFRGSQVFMFTPDEAVDHSRNDQKVVLAVCLGKSDWLKSFAPTHLARCEHYQLSFYDERLDIICEGVEAAAGAYRVA